MPAKTEKQRKAMGMALSIKRGKTKKKKAKGAVKKMLKMTKKQLSEFAKKR